MLLGPRILHGAAASVIHTTNCETSESVISRDLPQLRQQASHLFARQEPSRRLTLEPALWHEHCNFNLEGLAGVASEPRRFPDRTSTTLKPCDKITAVILLAFLSGQSVSQPTVFVV